MTLSNEWKLHLFVYLAENPQIQIYDVFGTFLESYAFWSKNNNMPQIFRRRKKSSNRVYKLHNAHFLEEKDQQSSKLFEGLTVFSVSKLPYYRTDR